MRNIFDQYDQPENRLTHALVCSLASDRRLIRLFLKRLKIRPVPPLRELRLAEQQVPGVAVSGDEGDSEGLPDACIFDQDGWAVLIESKVQAPVKRSQIERHLKTAARHGYDRAIVVVIAVDRPTVDLPEGTKVVQWRELYHWFRRFPRALRWARTFVEYLEVFEARMIARDYLTQGTLTMFDGLHFDKENPYTHREAKRLIRLLRDELRQRQDLQNLGVRPDAKGRPAITGRGTDSAWDFLPLAHASDNQPHTAHPHLTLAMNREHAIAAATVPNGVRGGLRSKLEKIEIEGFRQLVRDLEIRLRPIVARSKGAYPRIYVTQRHYATQRSPAVIDGRLEADVRTIVGAPEAGVKCQPEWVDAIYQLLTRKRSNIQLGVEIHFKYTCPVVRTPKVIGLFADTYLALQPLLNFVLREN